MDGFRFAGYVSEYDIAEELYQEALNTQPAAGQPVVQSLSERRLFSLIQESVQSGIEFERRKNIEYIRRKRQGYIQNILSAVKQSLPSIKLSVSISLISFGMAIVFSLILAVPAVDIFIGGLALGLGFHFLRSSK